MERSSSEQQAKILMSAFTDAKAGSGLGDKGTSLLTAKTGDSSEQTEQEKSRCAQLEREISQLTNKNLQLQEENEVFKSKLKETSDQQSPSKQQEAAQLIEDETNEKIQIALAERDQEVESLKERN